MISEKASLSILIILTTLVISSSIAVMVIFYSYIFLMATLIPVAICSLYFILLLAKRQNPQVHGNRSIIRRLPFIFFPILIIPLIITLTMAFLYSIESYIVLISFGLAFSYINIFVYLPAAIYERFIRIKRVKTSKRRYISQPTSYPLITIIVPAYNEESGIQRTLDSLIEADYPHKQLIVVDDGSTDQTYAVASRYVNKSFMSNTISLIRKRNGGKSSALNYALRFSKGDVLVIVDADSIIERNALKELVKEFQQSYNNNNNVVGFVPNALNLLELRRTKTL